MRKCLRRVVESLTGNETWRPRSFSSGKSTFPMNFDDVCMIVYHVLLYYCTMCNPGSNDVLSRRAKKHSQVAVSRSDSGSRPKMFFHLENHVGIWTRACKPYLLNPGRTTSWLHAPLVTGTCFRTMNTASHHRLSFLPLVHSAINLALPFGPFDDPAVTHRASCNAGLIPPEEEEQLLPMFLSSTSLSGPIGFLRPKVVDEILKNHQECGRKSIWNVLHTSANVPWAVCFAERVADFEARTRAMRVVLERWKTEGLFPDILKGMGVCFHYVSRIQFSTIGWSNETYPVYTPRQERPDSTSSLAFGIERSALPLFGFANFGCLLTGKLVYCCPPVFLSLHTSSLLRLSCDE